MTKRIYVAAAGVCVLTAQGLFLNAGGAANPPALGPPSMATTFALLVVPASQALPRKPHVELKSYSAHGRTVNFLARICYSRGPKAFGLVRETRRVGGSVKATSSASDPLGWDLSKPEPYHCEAYAQEWTLSPSLQGHGDYTVVIRVRDATGVSNAVSFTVHR